MKWAAFEETIGSIDEAREILRQLVAKYPMLLEARYYMQKVHIYLEYHSISALVRIGTPTPSPASECVPPPRVGTHSSAGECVGGPNSDDWRKSLLLCLPCECTSTCG